MKQEEFGYSMSRKSDMWHDMFIIKRCQAEYEELWSVFITYMNQFGIWKNKLGKNVLLDKTVIFILEDIFRK